MGNRGSIPGKSQVIPLFSTTFGPARGPIQPPVRGVTVTLSPKIIRLRREGDTHTNSVEYNKEWHDKCAAPFAFVVLHRDNFTFTLYTGNISIATFRTKTAIFTEAMLIGAYQICRSQITNWAGSRP